MKTKSMGRARE